MRYWLALDIDETLADTDRDRFQQLESLYWNPWYNYEEYHNHVERVNNIRAHEEAQQRMKDKIHDNEYQKNISLIPWALKAVQTLHTKKELFTYYITARPESVVTWTQERLLSHWFPNLPIIAKPLDVSKEKEHLWKAETLYKLYNKWVIWIIDDQIKLLNQMNIHFPDYKWTIHLIISEKNSINIEPGSLNFSLSNSWDELYNKLASK